MSEGVIIPAGTLVRVRVVPSVRTFAGRLGFVDALPSSERDPYTIHMLDTAELLMFYRDELEVAGGDTYITKDTTT